jgi:hypothetical protein
MRTNPAGKSGPAAVSKVACNAAPSKTALGRAVSGFGGLNTANPISPTTKLPAASGLHRSNRPTIFRIPALFPSIQSVNLIPINGRNLPSKLTFHHPLEIPLPLLLLI